MRNALAILLAFCAAAVSAQEFTTLKGHGGPIMGIAVSPQGQVASASFDNSVGLWDGRTPHWLEGHEAAVTVVGFTPDGVPISGGDDYAIRLWGSEPRELGRHKGKVTSLAISPDGAAVVSGSWDGTLRLWPLSGSVARQLPDPGAGVNVVAFDSRGRLFAGMSDGGLLRYDTLDGVPFPLVRHGFGVNVLSIGQGWIAYGAVDGGTRVIDAETGKQIADFTLDRRPILSMAYHAATGQIAVGDGHGYIMMLDVRDWTISRDFRAIRRGPIWALAFSPDGETIYAGGLDDVVYAWPVALLDRFDAAASVERTFLKDAISMPNGERQFMRKCSICHALDPGPSRKAGPSLHGLFGRRAGTQPGYGYSQTLQGSDIVWDETTVDLLFDQGPDHYIPGSKMPMQVIRSATDRADLIRFLKQTGQGE